jgi:ParB/RepB/Spo0J family partition protein
MRKFNSNKNVSQKININDVVVTTLTETLYDYSNREIEINALAESISQVGQQQPVIVVRNDSKYNVVDGVLRLRAMIRLNFNEIDAIICEFPITDEFSLLDLIVHNQIHKQKTVIEKLNEVKSLLRIDSKQKNPLRDKEKRVSLISSLLGGKGWGRNNVFSLERILLWELKNGSELEISRKVISNELTVNKALEAIGLFENPLFDREKEKESKIVEGYLKGNYPADRAVKLMVAYDTKKAEGHSVVKLYKKEKKNYTVIKGNIEEIQLPDDLQIDTIFTSPPYYRLVKYGDDPNELGWEKTPDEYVKRLCNILMKCYWKLKNTGSMFVNLGETYEDGECLGITERVTLELIKRGVRFVDRIIWRKGSNKPNGNQVKRLNPGYETILFFSKTKDFHFERFRIASEKTLGVARGCKEKGSSKRNYHIPNNYDQFRSVLSDNEVSNIINVQINKNRTKHINGEEVHPATFSNNLPVIPLLISTPKNRKSVVFDPFMGSGSCGVASLLLGFRFVGVELYDKNIDTAERILSGGQDEYDEDSLNSLLKDIESPDDSEDLLENNQAA